jgi:preprotein translocase subunit SecD
MRAVSRAGLLVVVAAVVFAAGCSTSTKAQAPLPTVASPESASPAVSAKQSLEFRQVKLALAASNAIKATGGSGLAPQRCSALVTPVAERKPTNASEMLFDRRRAYCYLLGPTLVTGASVDSATVVYDPATTSWAADVHFRDDDFLTKIARPLVKSQIAVVLTGFVQAVATIRAGMPGTHFEIIGGFTQVGAADVAAAILGVAPSSVQVSASQPVAAASPVTGGS